MANSSRDYVTIPAAVAFEETRPSLLWTKNPTGKPCVLGDNLLGSLLVEQEYVGTVKVTWVRIHGRAGKGIH